MALNPSRFRNDSKGKIHNNEPNKNIYEYKHVIKPSPLQNKNNIFNDYQKEHRKPENPKYFTDGSP